MKLITKGALATAALLIIASVAFTASSSALTITPINTKVSGNLTAGSSAVFTQGDLRIECTTHTVTATTGNGPSVSLLAANNKYTSSSGTAVPKCDVFLGGSKVGSATVTVLQTWTLTATSVTSGKITVPNNAVSIQVSTILGTCTDTVQASTVNVTLTNNNLSTDANNSVNVTASGFPCSSGVATQQETITFTPAVSVSP